MNVVCDEHGLLLIWSIINVVCYECDRLRRWPVMNWSVMKGSAMKLFCNERGLL